MATPVASRLRGPLPLSRIAPHSQYTATLGRGAFVGYFRQHRRTRERNVHASV
jgi:hypothetical protein